MKKEIALNELKSIQLDLLRELHGYCEKHGLVYYLAYGTLIGALRHNGYIPWDDDIDVMMPRADYDRLIKAFNQGSGPIKVISYETDSDYYLPFAKLVHTDTVMQEQVNNDKQIGVYIDIFPLDNLSDDHEDAVRRMDRAGRFNYMVSLKNIKKSSSRKFYKNAILVVGSFILRAVSLRTLFEKMKSVTVSKETAYIGVVTGISKGGPSRVFKKEWFSSRTLHDFEQEQFYVPCGGDAFLRNLYGDYMKLPPKEQQKSHHVFEAWWK